MNPLGPLRKYYRTILQTREELRLQRLIQAHPVLRKREELPLLLNILNLRGTGVEIGVQRATFSELILSEWSGTKLYSIDPWMEFDDPGYEDKANVEDSAQEANFQQTQQRLKRFGERSEIIRKTSLEGADDFENASLDFVYIDAQHHYEAVVEDLAAWFPKVRAGGLIAGHDYLDGLIDGDLFGVRRAVDEFANREGLTVAATLEPDYPSWFILKPPLVASKD